MFSEWLLEMLVNDLTKLKDEINLYKDEKDIWLTRGEIKNTAGNLCLHLLGNINYMFGNLIGHIAYQRDREREFTDKNISRADLNNRIDATIEVVKKSLPKLTDEGIYEKFPAALGGKERATGFTLIFFTNHFNYHLGQINYHRRLIEGAR